MKALGAYGLGIALMLTAGAHAQGFTEDTNCWTWHGGKASSGAYTHCAGPLLVQAKPAAPPPVQASPIMMPMAAPVSCAPPPKPVLHKKRPVVRKVC
jgi:hypothetical protein